MSESSNPFARLGPALAWLREQRGLTQGQVAALAGTSSPHLSRIETGQALPKLETLGKLLLALEADLTLLGLAHRAVEGPAAGTFEVPEELPLHEKRALLLSVAGFHEFLAATAFRLRRQEVSSGDPPVE